MLATSSIHPRCLRSCDPPVVMVEPSENRSDHERLPLVRVSHLPSRIPCTMEQIAEVSPMTGAKPGADGRSQGKRTKNVADEAIIRRAIATPVRYKKGDQGFRRSTTLA